MKKIMQYATTGLVLLATMLLAACGDSNSGGSATATPTVSSVTPTTATIGTAVSITVTGSNLPLTAVFTMQDATCGSPTVNSATTITQSCTPGGSAGTKSITVLTASGGTVIDASQTITVAARLPDTGITDQQCYKAYSDTLVSCSDAAAMALNDQQDGMITPGTSGMSHSRVESYPLTSCVQDNKTGLIWEGKTDDSGLRDKDNYYTNYDDTTQAQKWGGSNWVNPRLEDIVAATNTVGYINHVNSIALCGYTDWRLPTADELQGVVNYSIPYSGPTITSIWFQYTKDYNYWSASPSAGTSYEAWYVGFDDGSVDRGTRGDTYSVRLVRGVSTVTNRYSYSSDDGQVTDSKTNLTWQRCVAGMSWSGTTCTGTAANYTHEAALVYAKTQTGWKLPNIKELASIVDRTRSNPAIDTSAFPATPAGYTWSASPYAGGSYSAWGVDFDNGAVDHDYRSGTYYVRLVRAGQ